MEYRKIHIALVQWFFKVVALRTHKDACVESFDCQLASSAKYQN